MSTKQTDEVTSLFISNQLKELGVVFGTKHSWRRNQEGAYELIETLSDINEANIAAFTTTDLLFLMPTILKKKEVKGHGLHRLIVSKEDTCYRAAYVCTDCRGWYIYGEAATPAESLGNLFVTLLKDGFWKIPG